MTYSSSEEFANVVTHGLAFIVSLLAFFYLIGVMPLELSISQKASIIIYGLSLMLMFLSSTLYHAVINPLIKQILKQLDHCSIYLLIAGTYTPILTIVIPGTISRLILLTVWIMAAVGIVFKIFLLDGLKKYQSDFT